MLHQSNHGNHVPVQFFCDLQQHHIYSEPFSGYKCQIEIVFHVFMSIWIQKYYFGGFPGCLSIPLFCLHSCWTPAPVGVSGPACWCLCHPWLWISSAELCSSSCLPVLSWVPALASTVVNTVKHSQSVTCVWGGSDSFSTNARNTQVCLCFLSHLRACRSIHRCRLIYRKQKNIPMCSFNVNLHVFELQTNLSFILQTLETFEILNEKHCFQHFYEDSTEKKTTKILFLTLK